MILIAFIASLLIAFYAGGALKEKQYKEERLQRCKTLISFAMDKAENEDLSESGVFEALVSNLYAAYESCDSLALSSQLHDLWNTLTTEGNLDIEDRKALMDQLNIIAEQLAMMGA